MAIIPHNFKVFKVFTAIVWNTRSILPSTRLPGILYVSIAYGNTQYRKQALHRRRLKDDLLKDGQMTKKNANESVGRELSHSTAVKPAKLGMTSPSK